MKLSTIAAVVVAGAGLARATTDTDTSTTHIPTTSFVSTTTTTVPRSSFTFAPNTTSTAEASVYTSSTTAPETPCSAIIINTTVFNTTIVTKTVVAASSSSASSNLVNGVTKPVSDCVVATTTASKTLADGSVTTLPADAFCQCGGIQIGLLEDTISGTVYGHCAGSPYPTIYTSLPTATVSNGVPSTTNGTALSAGYPTPTTSRPVQQTGNAAGLVKMSLGAVVLGGLVALL